jgi:ComF family protein
MWLKNIFDLFFPETCHGCGTPLYEHEKMLCDYCKFNLPFTNFHKVVDNEVEQVFYGRVYIYQATSLLHFSKHGSVQSLMHNLKYKNRPDIGIYLGKIAGKQLKNYYSEVDILMPVPLHKSKLKKRGYNQSEMIAKGISLITGIPIADNLQKVKATKTQTKKSREERYLNTLDSFQVVNPDFLSNKHILIVDDVLTTGATLEAAITALLKTGVNMQISIFTLAKA